MLQGMTLLLAKSLHCLAIRYIANNESEMMRNGAVFAKFEELSCEMFGLTKKTPENLC
jgi:hypothetical protein